MLELLLFKRIYCIIINNIKVTNKNAKHLLSLPKIRESLSIDQIDHEMKVLIDSLVMNFGINATLVKIADLRKEVELLTDFPYQEMFIIALDNLSTRLMNYYEGIVYPIVLKHLLRIKENGFNEKDLLDDIKRNASAEENILCTSKLDQIMLESFSDEDYLLRDIKNSYWTRSKIKNVTTKFINQYFSKKEIMTYGNEIINSLCKKTSPDISIFLKCAIKVLNDIYSHEEKKSKKIPTDTRQLKIPGF